MIGIFLAVAILAFGIYLKQTDKPGFQSSKKFAWLFIALGLITLLGKFTLLYLQQ